MTLGWQGFSFEHPDDWALSRVTGTRSRGFLVLSSSGAISCQVRWEPSGDPSAAALRYLKSLSTRKNKVEYSLSDSGEWKRTGATHGRGFATALEDGRLMLIEVMGRAKDQLLPPLRAASSSLCVSRLWSVFGLSVFVPEEYELNKAEFLSARTRLTFRARGGALTAERFGLAAQLLGDADLESWLRSAFLGFAGETHQREDGLGLGRTRQLMKPAERVYARCEPELNQMTVLHGRGRRLELLPEWEWFGPIQNSKQS